MKNALLLLTIIVGTALAPIMAQGPAYAAGSQSQEAVPPEKPAAHEQLKKEMRKPKRIKTTKKATSPTGSSDTAALAPLFRHAFL